MRGVHRQRGHVYKQAKRAWGDSLPGICQRTYDAVESLFDDYKEQQNKTVEETQT
ncbi:MAG: hypothetical protein K6A72_09210 [Lachnospiraceae bacterium]|nr:hypothetical protein [Lachnospiraceae bacterium]